uniref:Phosducin domain-containing protein n=1 Tax=Macrostomum lignano TaxID=282301 RepID=A0A1I8IXT3_9PLAT
MMRRENPRHQTTSLTPTLTPIGDCIQEESMEDFKARQLEKQKNLQQSSSGYTDIGIESFLNSPSPASSSASAASSSRLIDKVNKELERRGGSYLPRGSSVDNGERRGIDELDDDGDPADAAAFDSDDRNVDDEGEAFSEFGQLVYKRMRLLEEESQDRSRDRRLNDSISAKASASAEDKATKQQQQSEQKQQSLAEELKAKRESLVAAIKSDFSTRKSSTASDPGDFTVLAGTRLRLTRLKVSSLDWEQRLMRGRRLTSWAGSWSSAAAMGVQPVLVAVLVGAVQQQQQKRQSGGSKSSYSIWRLADLARLDQQPAGLFLFG